MIDMKNLLISISPQMYLMKIIVILLIFILLNVLVSQLNLNAKSLIDLF